jgi:hypothetical protein
MLLKQLRRKFGEVPAEAEERLRQITDPEALDDLAERLIEAASLADLKLTTDGRKRNRRGSSARSN